MTNFLLQNIAYLPFVAVVTMLIAVATLLFGQIGHNLQLRVVGLIFLVLTIFSVAFHLLYGGDLVWKMGDVPLEAFTLVVLLLILVLVFIQIRQTPGQKG